jgi:hypothetical protein
VFSDRTYLQEVDFEEYSFKNMVEFNRSALLKMYSGIIASKVLNKVTREHMKKLGILVLNTSCGKRYALSDKTMALLGLKSD